MTGLHFQANRSWNLGLGSATSTSKFPPFITLQNAAIDTVHSCGDGCAIGWFRSDDSLMCAPTLVYSFHFHSTMDGGWWNDSERRPEAKIDRVPLACDSIIVRLYLMLEWWRLSYRHGGLRLGTGVMQLQASPIEIVAWLWHRPIRILTVESISRLQSNRSGCGNEMCDSLEERFAIGPVCVARPRLGRERSGQEEQEEADHPPLDPLDAGWALRMLS